MSEWQVMETAPKDGTVIQALGAGGVGEVDRGRAWRLKALSLARDLAIAQSALDMEAHCFPGDSWQNKQPAIDAAEKALMAHLETVSGVALPDGGRDASA